MTLEPLAPRPDAPSLADGLNWVKSSHSGGGGNCVEVAAVDHLRYIRDSKDPHGPVLAVTPEAFTDFLTAAATGKLDGPE
ncbi:DUF397 domain-containing protein [Streptomyces sp. BE20]|uniref:DUF397 domain-containing protein n=1 Tax=Streptomyces sp. BE20 TaxID=3002525 RepID=UPI002E790346|nr:DUF397 domain-containing protein [Streptomyces sp. BE20]MEE1820968.1 DUF397 domain-containing protein [Streptomyces sp. BE20]